MIDSGAWPGLQLIERVAEGARNEVWRAELDGALVAVRQSRRSPASLVWELDVLEHVSGLGFHVPRVCLTAAGERSYNGVVVQRWLEGEAPATPHEWRLVAAELQRLHKATVGYPQRPGCCTVVELAEHRTSVDADLDAMPTEVQDQVVTVFDDFEAADTSLIHGDPDDTNIRITPDGRVGLLDWDESRVDVTWHDVSNLGVQVLNDADHRRAQRLSNAWEAATGWVVEPDYARRRLAQLG